MGRGPGRARYFVYDQFGTELRQVERDVTSELAQAIRQHKNLTDAEREARA